MTTYKSYSAACSSSAQLQFPQLPTITTRHTCLGFFLLGLDTLQSLSAPLVQLLLLFHINSYELFYYTHAHTLACVCVCRFMCSVVCIYRFLFLFTVRSMALLMKMNTCVRFGATRDPNERCRLSKKSI